MQRKISLILLFVMIAEMVIPISPRLNFGSIAYAEMVEEIQNTCPSDPTQNGKCGLGEMKVDNAACKTVGGQEICREWWRKDFVYKCTGDFDPDSILAKIGTQYCGYRNECTEWLDVSKKGGEVTCRIYYDTMRPGCDSGAFKMSCVVDDCGELPQRCTLKNYVKYSDIEDRANFTRETGSLIVNANKSGVRLGVYAYKCPREVRKICKSYGGQIKCPDGSTQVCNKVKVCKDQKSVTVREMELKSCIADATMDQYAYPKESDEADAIRYKANCVKTGESDRCTYPGCTDNAAGGIGRGVGGRFFSEIAIKGVSADAKTINVAGVVCFGCHAGSGLTGNYSCPSGFSYSSAYKTCVADPIIPLPPAEPTCSSGFYEPTIKKCITDATPECISGYHYDTSINECIRNDMTSINVNIHIDNDIGRSFSLPHGFTITYKGYECTTGCAYRFTAWASDGPFDVYVGVRNDYENFNCYLGGYKDCIVSNAAGEACTRLASTDIEDLICVELDTDVDISSKKLCKRYILNYECPKDETELQCSNYEEVLKCNNGAYPIKDVRADTYDFSADFARSMALAQAANELKHVWSGEPHMCEKGMWWLFDNQSVGAFLASKVVSYAMNYLGSEVFSQLGPTMQTFAECIGSAAQAGLSIATANSRNRITVEQVYSGDEIPDAYNKMSDWFTGKATGSPPNLSAPVDSGGDSGGDEWYGGETRDSQNGAVTSGVSDYVGGACKMAASAVGGAASGNLGGTAVGLVASFVGGPLVGMVVSSIYQIVSSIDSCNACTSEKCATAHNQYKDFVLVSNKFCHFVGNKCTSKTFFGCQRTGYKYCCYNSKFARILVEQAYSQLGYSWGSYSEPSCTNLTFDDLQRLDFTTMDFSEFMNDLTVKMKGTFDENNLQQKVKERINLP